MLSVRLCEYAGSDEDVAEGIKHCIFHDENYLKGENYDKNKEVRTRFQTKLSSGRPLNFSGYHLPDISFRDYEFSGPLDFASATFTKGAYFLGAKFKEAYFGRATFIEKANFDGDEFTEKADFGRATFTEKANFSEAIFTKEVDFFDTQFQIADFSQVKFLNEIRFSGSEITFKDETLFRYRIFEQPNSYLMYVIYPRCRLLEVIYERSHLRTRLNGEERIILR